MTEKKMIEMAKLEINAWRLPPGLVMMILFAYIHRLRTGNTVEDTFFKPVEPVEDYQI